MRFVPGREATFFTVTEKRAPRRADVLRLFALLIASVNYYSKGSLKKFHRRKKPIQNGENMQGCDPGTPEVELSGNGADN